MLRVNGKRVLMKYFPNREIYLDFLPKEEERKENAFHKLDLPDKKEPIWVGLQFEGNDDLIGLALLVGHLRDLGYKELFLSMPYIPYSTMDHIDKDKRRPLSLKYIAAWINSLHFDRVVAMEPHSHVSENLFDRLESLDITVGLYQQAVRDLDLPHSKVLVVFPDDGAMKRYAGEVDSRYVVFAKKRNFEDGKVHGLRCVDPLPEFDDEMACVILDDLCRGGFTFEAAAKILKEAGCKKVVLCVTHLEKVAFNDNKILGSGKYVDHIYATDSCLPGFEISNIPKLSICPMGSYPFNK